VEGAVPEGYSSFNQLFYFKMYTPDFFKVLDFCPTLGIYIGTPFKQGHKQFYFLRSRAVLIGQGMVRLGSK
jgi:hypothetical protein